MRFYTFDHLTSCYSPQDESTVMTTVDHVAADLFAAYSTKQPIEPPRTTIHNLDLDGAYAIQQAQERAFIAAGHKIVGRKIGLTSIAMQQQLGVDSPDFGFFSDQRLYHAGDAIDVAQFISPKVEPELAFVLAADISATPTTEEVIAAVGSVHRAVEIIDSRVRDWDIRLVDTVADNASCGAVVIDDAQIDVSADLLPTVSARMFISGRLAGEGIGAAVMGHPLAPLKWLAEVLGAQGVGLNAGDIILTGSFCGAAAVAPGQEVTIDYGTYGSMSLTFV